MVEGRPETGGLNGKKLHCEIGSNLGVIVTVEYRGFELRHPVIRG
jgi:hypothetical protein